MSRRTQSVSAPRSSASVIVVNALNEVLLVQRSRSSQSFAGAHVFPGGNFDERQDESLAMTAIRELFEETGLLLASSTSHAFPSETELDDAREAVHAQRLLFRDFLKQSGLTLDVSSLLPFTQWVTPPTIPRRFHTHFFITFLPRPASSPSSASAPTATGFTSGNRQERLPTPDGGLEVIAASFIHPARALTQNRAGEISLMPPQGYLLTTLAEVLPPPAACVDGHARATCDGHTGAARDVDGDAPRERLRALAQGAFGGMVVHPLQLPEKDGEGRAVMTYEGDETRGGSSGRLHRCLVRFGKGGVATEVIIQRNFDVFTELEEVLRVAPAKARL